MIKSVSLLRTSIEQRACSRLFAPGSVAVQDSSEAVCQHLDREWMPQAFEFWFGCDPCGQKKRLYELEHYYPLLIHGLTVFRSGREIHDAWAFLDVHTACIAQVPAHQNSSAEPALIRNNADPGPLRSTNHQHSKCLIGGAVGHPSPFHTRDANNPATSAHPHHFL